MNAPTAWAPSARCRTELAQQSNEVDQSEVMKLQLPWGHQLRAQWSAPRH